MTKTKNGEARPDFAPTLLACGLFLSPRSPRGTCVRCWGSGISKRDDRPCRCGSETRTPCTGGRHVAPGYIATTRSRPSHGIFVETMANAVRTGRARKEAHA